jgi:antibiotic biosynthesis monooxygenase (ABM) superfamily enzyme
MSNDAFHDLSRDEALYRLLDRPETRETVKAWLHQHEGSAVWLKVEQRLPLTAREFDLVLEALREDQRQAEQKIAEYQRQSDVMRELHALLVTVPGFRASGLTTREAIDRLSADDRARAEGLLAQLPAMMAV